MRDRSSKKYLHIFYELVSKISCTVQYMNVSCVSCVGIVELFLSEKGGNRNILLINSLHKRKPTQKQ